MENTTSPEFKPTHHAIGEPNLQVVVYSVFNQGNGKPTEIHLFTESGVEAKLPESYFNALFTPIHEPQIAEEHQSLGDNMIAEMKNLRHWNGEQAKRIDELGNQLREEGRNRIELKRLSEKLADGQQVLAKEAAHWKETADDINRQLGVTLDEKRQLQSEVSLLTSAVKALGDVLEARK